MLCACQGPVAEVETPPVEKTESNADPLISPQPDVYADFPLVADLSGLNDSQRRMLVLLIEASQIMDDLFWRQAYGDDYQDWLASIGVDEARQYAELNYGPWDRLNDDAPFMTGVGEKPLGARFYPPDMTKEEFMAADLEGKAGLYSFVRRDESGALILVPFHVEYAVELQAAADLLRDAGGSCRAPGVCKLSQAARRCAG